MLATYKLKYCRLHLLSNKVSDLKMIGIVSKILFFTSASRAVNITTARNIFTREYLGLAFLQEKEKEAHAKAGKNAIKIKDNILKAYNQRGIKDLKINNCLRSRKFLGYSPKEILESFMFCMYLGSFTLPL